MSSKPIITALAPWFGGKRTLAGRIVEELGEHKAYVEPFCGSMAVLFAKPRSTVELVNDLHGDLINLALVVQDVNLGVQLYRRVRRLPFHEEYFRGARATMRQAAEWDGVPSLDRALAFLVFSWMGRNSAAGLEHSNSSDRVCVRWGRNGGGPGKRWLNVGRSIPGWHRRLQGVTILRRDGFQILEKVKDEAGTAIYVDPPYLVKADRYLYDFESEDHDRLAEVLSRFRRVRVVVSYYDHPRLAELYPAERWHRRDVPIAKATANPTGSRLKKRKHIAPEVLLINGPSLAESTKNDEETLPLFRRQ